MRTRTRRLVALVPGVLLAAGTFAVAQEGEWRWRLSVKETRLALYIADTDEPTDDIRSPSPDCEKGSKLVKVFGDMGDDLRRALADALANNIYPLVEPVPDGRDGGGLLEPAFTDMGGWTYSFQMPVNAKALSALRATGKLSFRFNNALIEGGETAGLERVAEFQDLCARGSW